LGKVLGSLEGFGESSEGFVVLVGRAGESPWEGLGKGLGSLEGFGEGCEVLGKFLCLWKGLGKVFGFRGWSEEGFGVPGRDWGRS
jgi:hypothetical protein